MVIKFFGKEIPCVRAEKGADFIRAYGENGVCVLDARPINDFSDYVLEGGDWGQPEMTAEDRIDELENIVAALLFGDWEAEVKA